MSALFPSRIYLTGFMGSGKTTIGKELALLLKRSFIDLDSEISDAAGKSVSKIFEQDGEAAFRRLEKQYLKKISIQREDAVIALGGGTTCDKENLALVLNSGFVVYLQLPLPLIIARLEKDKSHRPLIAHLDSGQLAEFVTSTLEKRKTFYERAHLMVNGLNLNASHLYEIIRATIP